MGNMGTCFVRAQPTRQEKLWFQAAEKTQTQNSSCRMDTQQREHVSNVTAAVWRQVGPGLRGTVLYGM